MKWRNPCIFDVAPPSETEALTLVTNRVLKLLDGLSTVDPLLREFFLELKTGKRVPVFADQARLAEYISARSCFDKPTPNPHVGYFFSAGTFPEKLAKEPRAAGIRMNAGGEAHNRVSLWIGHDIEPDPRLTSFATAKAILYAMADVFEPRFSYVDPGTLDQDTMPPGPGHKPLYARWMMLLPPDLASRITPPPGAVTEVRPDGSLFMAATDERFDAANPAHEAMAYALKDAVAPIDDWWIFEPYAPTKNASSSA